MRRRTIKSRVAEELSAIPDLTRSELIKRWKRAYRWPAPKGISRRLLEYSAAYQVQVNAYGGLKPSVRRKLERQASPKKASAQPVNRSRRSDRLAPGTCLVREWHGETHTVEVLRQGFAYDGELYRSLSEVARVITGAHWSGPRFFGL